MHDCKYIIGSKEFEYSKIWKLQFFFPQTLQTTLSVIFISTNILKLATKTTVSTFSSLPKNIQRFNFYNYLLFI